MTLGAAAILKDVDVFLFDVFGTVVDWRSTVERELRALVALHDLKIAEEKWEANFAQEWRTGYLETTRAIAEGASGTTNVDLMHRQILDRMLDVPGSRWQFLSAVLDDKERERLNGVWHRLDGWPDSRPGLYALKKHVICGALSNGNVRLLVDMAKHADLPWDVIFSTELFDTFKPNPKAYQSALRHISVEPTRCAMVAAHEWDLRGASAVGLRTVYVPRLGEGSPMVEMKTKVEGGEVDVIICSFEELAGLVAAAQKDSS